MHALFAILFSIFALVAAGLSARILVRQGRGHVEEVNYWRPLGTLAAALVALLAPGPVWELYKGFVVFALLIAFVADLVWMIPGTPLIVFIGAKLPTYFVLWVAIAALLDWHIPSPWVLIAPAVAVGTFFVLRPGLKELSPWVIAYLANAALLGWVALDLVGNVRAWWALAAGVGVLLLLASDAVLGVSAFRRPIRHALPISMVLLLLGQLALAWSVWETVTLPW
jgi:hypothetical protein